MNNRPGGRWRRAVGAKVFSPAGFLVRALLIAVAFAVCHFVGLREHTSFLSGTTASVSGGMDRSLLLGTLYIAVYLAFVLLCPILLIAAALLALWQRRRPSGEEDQGSGGAEDAR